VETITKFSPLKSEKAKKNLEFGKQAEYPKKIVAKFFLNLPYSDSDSEPLTEKMVAKPSTVGRENIEEIETPMDEKEEAEVEAPDLEIPATSTSKISKSSKIENLKEEILDLKLLERVIESQNQTIMNTSIKVRDCFERLDKMHVKE
jgi:hypothetical protein